MNEALDINNWKDEDDNVRKRRDDYWRILSKIRTENNLSSTELDEFVVENYGIEIQYDKNGDILSYYKVVDEQKYLIFLLKY